MKHVPEVKIGKADRLSRRSDWKVGIEKDNKNQKLIKEKWICSLTEVVIERPEVSIIIKIKIAREKNEDVIRVVEEMKKVRVKVLKGNE